ncbi:MAG TPA: hypothetical protein VGD17_05660 [Chitinophagaceae bacterium]
MRKLSFSILAIALLFQIRSSAQDRSPDSATIWLIAKAYNDSIVLRWAPSTAASWQLLNNSGYNILRMQKNSTDGKWTVLNEKPVIPLSLELMKKNLDRNNKFAAIAAQALYGKSVYPEKKGMAPSVGQGADILNDRYALSLQCADYSAPVAKAIALGWTDKTVSRGEVYIYKVVPAQNIKAVAITPLSLVVVNEKSEAAMRPEGLVAIGGDKKAELQWPRSQEENYSGFGIEISEDGKNFRPIHTSPFYNSLPDTANLPKDSLLQQLTEVLQHHHIFIDSLRKNYSTYYYRIRGINAFAEWSAYSEPVTVSGRDLTPPSSILLGTPESAGKKSIRLTWVKQVKEPDLKGFHVYRSRQVDGNYTLLNANALPATTTNFTDTGAFEHGPGFYIVTAIDTAGNQNPSIPVMGLVPDTTAPAMPETLTGSIDSTGLVHLSWRPNAEEDIKGYKVYFSHDPSQTFSQITLYPESGNSFTDSITLKTLTKRIYYRVVAVDLNNNHSPYSAILELKKPDLVRPTPPVIQNATISTAGVQLEFAGTASTDAVHYYIVRKEANADWKTVATIRHNGGSNNFSFRDTTIRHSVAYEYAAKTVDEDSLQSALCTPVKLQLRGTEELATISFTKASYDERQNAVILEWNYTSGDPHHFVLYRSLAGTPLERYRTFEKGTKEWKDLQVENIQQGYQYAIQAVYKNNAKMTRLEPGGVTVKK